MDFMQALKQLIAGKDVSRIGWAQTNPNMYVTILSNVEYIYCVNGSSVSVWTMAISDLTATDWQIIPS